MKKRERFEFPRMAKVFGVVVQAFLTYLTAYKLFQRRRRGTVRRQLRLNAQRRIQGFFELILNFKYIFVNAVNVRKFLQAEKDTKPLWALIKSFIAEQLMFRMGAPLHNIYKIFIRRLVSNDLCKSRKNEPQ